MGSWFNTVTKATIRWSGAILAGACDPRRWWGGPPGPQPAPWPACRQPDQVDFVGTPGACATSATEHGEEMAEFVLGGLAPIFANLESLGVRDFGGALRAVPLLQRAAHVRRDLTRAALGQPPFAVRRILSLKSASDNETASGFAASARI